MELIADLSRLFLAVSALLFALINVVYGRPLPLAVFSLVIAVAAAKALLMGAANVPSGSTTINLGTSGLLMWFALCHPHIGLIASWRADPWVCRWQDRKHRQTKH